MDSSLLAISPIDGRYHNKTEELNRYFSEFGLMRFRILVEIDYLCFLGDILQFPKQVMNNIKKLKEPSKVADNIAAHLNCTISEKQKIFETLSVKKRLIAIIKIMQSEASIIGVEKRIRGRVKTQMEKTQREYYLNEQLKAVQKELGDLENSSDEYSELEKKINTLKLTKEAKEKANAELKKLRSMT